jgi:ribosomal protein S18 acetylase RimI-like enzyme
MRNHPGRQPMVELAWRLHPDAAEALDEAAWRRCSQLIEECTGEYYESEQLRRLPLAEEFGCLVLEATRRPEPPHGLLFSMRLDETTARVLLFLVEPSLQSRGLGGQAWVEFARRANQDGVDCVQLEVREDNLGGQRFYHRLGLEAIGCLECYYGDGGEGLLMRGPLMEHFRQTG